MATLSGSVNTLIRAGYELVTAASSVRDTPR
jgi:hypothetical protein